jgi:hypothetical protein
MNKTALQWFIYKITANHDKHFKDFYKAEIEEALQMEREQIVKAHGNKKDYSFSQIDPEVINGEQYYNKTYGGEK